MDGRPGKELLEKSSFPPNAIFIEIGKTKWASHKRARLLCHYSWHLFTCLTTEEASIIYTLNNPSPLFRLASGSQISSIPYKTFR